MGSPVDWELAERIATRLTPRDPFAGSYLYDSLTADFAEATAEAEGLVEATTGLRSLAGPARARLVDRPDWVLANVRAFHRLLHPALERLGDRVTNGPSLPLALTRRVSAAEVGALLAWMSGRVLGQYDLLVIDDATAAEQDLVYYVGPNVLSLEKRFGFPPGEFRLWLALHEVTHRAQFTGVPWMREHYLGLVEQVLSLVDTDPGELMAALKHAARSVRQRQRRVRARWSRRGRRHRRAARRSRPGGGPHGPARGPRRRHHGPRRRRAGCRRRNGSAGSSGSGASRRRRW